MLTNSLDKLAKDFGVETHKSIFPYMFSIQNNFFYKGPTPALYFYIKISLDCYKDIYKEDWSFKDETIK